MKKLMSLMLSLLLIFMMSFSVSGAKVQLAGIGATFGECGDNLTWNYDSSNKTLTISGSGPMVDYEYEEAPWLGLSIYSVIVEEGVTSIGSHAFSELFRISEVVLPDTLTKIGSSAFFESAIKEITIPDNVSQIEYAAFEYCNNLKSITLPKSLLKLGNNAFKECENLTEVYFLNPLCEIYDSSHTIYKETIIYGGKNSTAKAYAGKYNRNFVEIEMEVDEPSGSCGENVNWSYDDSTLTLTISGSGEMVDYADENIAPWSIYPFENVIIESGITNIGTYAFSECKSLVSITIPNSVTEISSHAFYHCEALKNISIPSALEIFGESAFSGCISIESISIPSTVTSLPQYVFGTCQSIKDIYIPSSVTDIHKNAFQGCMLVQSIVVDKNNTVYDSRDNCNSIILTDSDTLYLGCKSTVIPESITAIDYDAFDIDFGPEELIIPGSVKTIGNNAFHATRIRNLVIEEGVEVIEDYAFSMVQSPEKLVIPKSVKNIGYFAFGFSMITELVILNPECEINDHSYTLPNYVNITIYGYEDSTAQAYAEKYKRNFEIYVDLYGYEIGDVDMDGKISVLDATKIQRSLAEIEVLDRKQLALADTDNDGRVSILDATAIQLKLALLTK